MLPYKRLGIERLDRSMSTSSYKRWKSDASIQYLKIKPSDAAAEAIMNRGYSKKHNPLCSTCNTQKSRSGSCFCD